MNSDQKTIKTRQAIINGLAIVGFLALLVASISLAVYFARFVPVAINSVGSAAVYMGSLFIHSDEPPSLSVISVPGNATTVPSETENVATDSPAAIIPIAEELTPSLPISVKPRPTITSPGDTTRVRHLVGGTAPQRSLSGLPDLIISITAIGYLVTPSTESFVESSTVPPGGRPAVKFSIKNIGTNIADQWRFRASIPTQIAYIYFSPKQQQLNPGEWIDYTLGFDQAIAGSNRTISISANFDRVIAESNFGNNDVSAQLTILGS